MYESGAVLNEYRVRSMTPEVLSSVVALEAECGLNSRKVEGYHRMLSNPKAVLLVAIEAQGNHDVVGLFSGDVVVDEFQIDNLAVSERIRRKGLGRELLRSALSRAGVLGAHTAILEVRSSNSSARAFYETEGFRIVGLRKRYYSDPIEDALLLSREIQKE